MDYTYQNDRFSTAMETITQEITHEITKPSILLRPKLSIDGDMWCVFYGDNPQDGLAGFGETPSKAMNDFDINYYHQRVKTIPLEDTSHD